MAVRTAPGRPPLLAVITFAALGAVVAWDVARAWTTEFLGAAYVDGWGTQWFYWWVGRQLLSGEGLASTDVLFFPWGKEVYLHTGGNVLDAAAALPVRWFLGPVAGYNVFAGLVLVVNALALSRLAGVLGAKPEAAWIAGALFAFNPFALQELVDGRPTQAMMAFLVLFLAEVALCVRGRDAHAPWRAGGLLLLTALGYWFYAFFGGVAALAAGAWGVVTAPRARRAATLGRLGLAAALGLLLTLPFALPMLGASEQVPGLLDSEALSLTQWRPSTREGIGVGIYVLDLLHRVAGFLVESKDEPGLLVFVPEDRVLLWTQLGAAAVGLAIWPTRWRGFVLALAGAALLIALGPMIQLGDVDLPNVPYLAMILGAPLLRRLWWPQRALAVVSIALAVAAAFALSRVQRLGRVALAGATALVALAWAVELSANGLAPLPTWSARVPAVYRCLARAGLPGAVIELPYASTQQHLFYQAIHGRKIFGGMVEDNLTFTPPGQVEFRRANSLVRTLLAAAADAPFEEAPSEADTAAVGALGYRYVVFDKSAYPAAAANGARVDTRAEGRGRAVLSAITSVLGPPDYQDDDSALWAPWGGGDPCDDPG